MNQCEHCARTEDFFLTRRQFLNRFGMGIGGLGLAALIGNEMFSVAARAADRLANPLAPKAPHFPARAKSVIHIFAQGAPSQVDTWDHKPELAKYDCKSLPGMDGVAYASPFKFEKHGQSGIEVSEVF